MPEGPLISISSFGGWAVSTGLLTSAGLVTSTGFAISYGAIA